MGDDKGDLGLVRGEGGLERGGRGGGEEVAEPRGGYVAQWVESEKRITDDEGENKVVGVTP